MSTFRDAEREWYNREPQGPECEWHPGEDSDGCPECAAVAEAAQPDTEKEAEGIA